MTPKPKPKTAPLFEARPEPFEVFRVPTYERGLLCRSSREAYDVFKSFEDAGSEYFLVVLLNPKNEILGVRYCSGTIDSAAVYPRQIALAALQTQATSLILMHNHPSGDPDPSLCDREITRQIFKMAHVLEAKVLDHIIIGRNS